MRTLGSIRGDDPCPSGLPSGIGEDLPSTLGLWYIFALRSEPSGDEPRLFRGKLAPNDVVFTIASPANCLHFEVVNLIVLFCRVLRHVS